MRPRFKSGDPAPPLPRWFLVTLLLLGCLLVAASVVAVGLAMFGVFRPYLMMPLSAVFTAIMFTLIWRHGKWRFGSAHGPSIAAIVIAIAAVLFNGYFAAEHLLVDRDPGVYVVTAKWLANTGRILFETPAEVFTVEPQAFAGSGFAPGRGATLYPQSLHLLPALMAAGEWLGGPRLMLRVVPVLAGSSLLFFFAFAYQFMRPSIAAGATLLLGVSLPQVYFSRDAYSEIPSQAFLFFGLFILLSAEAKRSGLLFGLAGLSLGGLFLARIDSVIFLVPIILYLCVRAATETRPFKSSRMLIGLTPLVALAGLDAYLFSPRYVTDLSDELLLALAGAGIAALFGAAAVIVWRRWSGLPARLKSWRGRLSAAAAALLILAAAFAFWVRPILPIVRDPEAPPLPTTVGLQQFEGVPEDPTRDYSELSLRWVGWYYGPGLALGVAGAAAMLAMLISGREARTLSFLLFTLLGGAPYIWRPSIVPDQPWAVRRLMVVLIPGLVLTAAWFVSRIWSVRTRNPSRGRTAVAVVTSVVALSALAVAGIRSWSISGFATQRGMLGLTERLCERLPEDAAVVIMPTFDLQLQYPQTVAAFCEVAVVIAPDRSQAVAKLAAQARAADRRPFQLEALPFEEFGERAGFLGDIPHTRVRPRLFGPPLRTEDLKPNLGLYLTSLD